ncbi:hypothetical protein ACHWQZ_G012741 [Mnemiopsis leidyi]
MSDSPVAKKLKIEDSEVTNGETVTTNGTADSVDKKENNSNNHQTEVVDEKKLADQTNNNNNNSIPHLNNNVEAAPPAQPTPPQPQPLAAAPATAAAPVTPATAAAPQATPTSQANRLDPNEIIAQLKESLRQEEAKLQFLRKLKLTQAKLKERQERIAAQNQTKEESKESATTLPAAASAATTLPPPPPLLKSAEQVAAVRCTNSPNISQSKATKPFSVIVSNSQTIKPKPDTSSLVNSLQSLSSISAPVIPTTNMHRTPGVSSIQPNRAAMAKILEEMILQQPSPKPKVLQWPICPNINDQEYLHYTGLEFIVDRLKNPTKPDTAAPSLDITCVVCGLDFSPEWEKTDFEDKFECYYCFTSKLRKTVREEHTERLKQGFIKVVQKEKEFERQLQNQQREEQLMQQKLAEQQRQQQQQIMEQQQRTLQLQLQQQTLEQLQRQQIANQLLQHLQKSRQQPGSTNSALNTLLQFTQDPTNQLLAQLTKRGQQASNTLNLLQNSASSNSEADKSSSGDHGGQSGQLREYLLDLLPRLPTQ